MNKYENLNNNTGEIFLLKIYHEFMKNNMQGLFTQTFFDLITHSFSYKFSSCGNGNKQFGNPYQSNIATESVKRNTVR